MPFNTSAFLSFRIMSFILLSVSIGVSLVLAFRLALSILLFPLLVSVCAIVSRCGGSAHVPCGAVGLYSQ